MKNLVTSKYDDCLCVGFPREMAGLATPFGGWWMPLIGSENWLIEPYATKNDAIYACLKAIDENISQVKR